MPDFNTMYELYDACTVMFFFRNKHIMIDLGTGNNNKVPGLFVVLLCVLLSCVVCVVCRHEWRAAEPSKSLPHHTHTPNKTTKTPRQKTKH